MWFAEVTAILLLTTNVVWSEDFCFSETFNISCPKKQKHDTILMKNALFGRMREGRCATSQYGPLDCYTDVLPVLDRMCTGKRKCSLPVSNLDIYGHPACPRESKSYLEADYSCITVQNVCRKRHVEVRVSRTMGYIRVNKPTNGNASCTWHIGVRRGQRIRLDVIDLTYDLGVSGVTSGRKHPSLVDDGTNPCPLDILVVQGKKEIKTPVCRVDRSRVRTLLDVSRGHNVKFKVTFNSDLSQQQLPNFLVRYQVQGCSTPLSLDGVIYTRLDSETVSARCNNTSMGVANRESVFMEDTRHWTLYCLGNTWIGNHENCTVRISEITTPFPYIESIWDFPNGIAVVILLGAGIGAVLGVFMLFVVVTCRKSCISDTSSQSNMKPQLSLVDIDVPYPDVSRSFAASTTTTTTGAAGTPTTTTTSTPATTATTTSSVSTSHPVLNTNGVPTRNPAAEVSSRMHSDRMSHRYMEDGRPVPPMRRTSTAQLPPHTPHHNNAHVYETIKL